MAYKQETDTPLMHCFSKLMHTKPWNKMRERTAAVAGRGSGNKVGLAHAEKIRNTPLEKKVAPVKAKGGGTKKVCLPKAKIASMSKTEKQRVVQAKQKAGKAGKYKRSSKSNVTGTASRNLKHWVQQDWRQVGNPSKKCGEK